MDEQTSPQTTNIESVQSTNSQKHGSKIGMAKKTFLLILVLALITIGLLWFALLPKKQAPSQTAIPTPTPDPVQTVLTISSSISPLATPSSYKTDIVISTGQDKVTAVQLELAYDPKVLTNVDITPNGFFTDPIIKIKKIDPEVGRITFVLGVSASDENGVLGQGILATISFSLLKGQKAQTTTIDFLPKTEVKTEGYSQSVLKSTLGALFDLTQLISTPSSSLKAATSSAQ